MIKANSKSKLTLWISQDIKEFGKRWSKGHDSSLSEMFSNFIRHLQKSEEAPSTIPPIIQKISGVVKGYADPEKTYKKHLEKKYLNDA